MLFEIELSNDQVKKFGLKALEDRLKKYESSNIEDSLDSFTIWIEQMLNAYKAELKGLNKELSVSRVVSETNIVAFEAVKERLKLYDLYRMNEEE